MDSRRFRCAGPGPEGDAHAGLGPPRLAAAPGVVTRYIEDGEERTDQSLYRVGFAVRKTGLFGGRSVVLLGLSLARRGVDGDLQAAVDRAEAAEAAKGLAAESVG